MKKISTLLKVEKYIQSLQMFQIKILAKRIGEKKYYYYYYN